MKIVSARLVDYGGFEAWGFLCAGFADDAVAEVGGRGAGGTANGASEGLTGLVSQFQREFVDGGRRLGEEEAAQPCDKDVIFEAAEFRAPVMEATTF